MRLTIAERSAQPHLESQQHNLEAIRCALETRISQAAGNTIEQKFAQNSLEEINARGSRLIAASSWTITALEIDFGDELDSGGLCILFLQIRMTSSHFSSSGVVKQGNWNRLPVAVKSFQMTGIKLSISDRQVSRYSILYGWCLISDIEHQTRSRGTVKASVSFTLALISPLFLDAPAAETCSGHS
jgi:hypothetical protein